MSFALKQQNLQGSLRANKAIAKRILPFFWNNTTVCLRRPTQNLISVKNYGVMCVISNDKGHRPAFVKGENQNAFGVDDKSSRIRSLSYHDFA